MACKHCGRSDDIPSTKTGRSGAVCRPCRRDQINLARFARGETNTAPEPVRRGARSRIRSRSVIDVSAVMRAHATASATGTSLVEALKAEGVL